MENNLIEQAHSYFDEESYMQLASQEKLNVEKVKKGLETIVPSLYLGFTRKSEANLRQLLDRLRAGFVKIDTRHGLRFPELFDRDSGDQEDEKTESLLEFWFDDAHEETFKNTRNFLELDTAAALKLFASAIPAVVAALTSNGEHWELTTIQANLNNNRDNFLEETPAGLPLTILSGEDDASDDDETPETDETADRNELRDIDPVRDVVFADPIVPRSALEDETPAAPAETESEYGKGAGWWWVIVPIVLLILWFLFGRGCTRSEPSVSDSNPTEVESLLTDSPASATAPIPMGTDDSSQQAIQLPLKDAGVLNAFSGGIEEALVHFLDSGYQSLSDEELEQRWFDFDHLNFEMGTSNMLADSDFQLDNLAAILNAYPQVKVKIGAFTDKSGEEEQNKKITNDRAMAVKNALDERGVGSQVMATEGYGSALARYESDAPETDRVHDQRVAISIRK